MGDSCYLKINSLFNGEPMKLCKCFPCAVILGFFEGEFCTHCFVLSVGVRLFYQEVHSTVYLHNPGG